MKLLICCNHSYPHIGGSEIVIQNIAEFLYNKFGYDITIFSFSIPKPIYHNGIRILPCPTKFNIFKKFIEKYNHIFIYSDHFRYWYNILENIEEISSKISIALVGMNFMLSSTLSGKNTLSLFREKNKYFNIITHSNNYQD